MRWCTDEELTKLLLLDPGYTVSRLRVEDVPAVVDLVRDWYPDITVGIGCVYLRPSFYEANVALADDETRDVAVWIFRHQGKFAAMWSDERIPESLAIYGRLIVVSPEHRKAHIGARIISSSEDRARMQGAEYMYANATLKHSFVQRGLEQAGYKLVGFAPGADRELAQDGTVKRVYEAVYALSLVSTSDCLMPEPKNLSPQALALFNLLFPQ